MRLITNQTHSREDFEKRLRFKTEPVDRVTDELRNVAVDMLAYMYHRDAIGLAANQVGLKIRLCVIDPAYMTGKRMPIVMFNPEFVECGDTLFESPEGCLSLPDLGLRVPRFRNTTVKFLGINGKEYRITDDNSLLASVIQHEVDHLDGILMIDRLLEDTTIQYKDSLITKV